ncbi:MAG: EpsG family protein [Lachnospiraceae bacterium]|nr:EpsG family protein [Lachnospiraceae bacterium]
MILYSITYFINSLGFFVKKKDTKLVKYIVLALLMFMSGTRYYMGGSDVLVYENVYNNGVPSVINVLTYFFTGVNHGVNTNYEIGFILLCSVVKTFHFSYLGFILIWTILFYTLMVKGLKDFVPNWSIYFAVFMYKIFFYDTFISIRQGLTIAMFCYMLQFIRDRKWYVYFPLCYLIFLEHNGAIILFPLYFITFLPISKKFIRNYALFFMPTWFISSRVDISSWIMNMAEFIGNTHSAEHWVESVETINGIHTLECYILVLVVIIFYEKIISSQQKKEVELVLKLFLITIPLFTLFRDWIILTREKDYFVLMYGIILGYLLEGKTTALLNIKENDISHHFYKIGKQNYIIISLMILIYCYIGMTRFVIVFDGGVLMNFTSFITENINLFK